jgi:stearoyl-CoA desaturase (delta-9 desaturase)
MVERSLRHYRLARKTSAGGSMVAASISRSMHRDIIYPDTIPFVLLHLSCLGVIWSGISHGAIATGIALYVVRMFAVTAGYHRYFSHRSFKTSRCFQFVLAWMAQSTAQKGVLWWAAVHRHHHRHSDTEADVHSPSVQGLLYAHVGWIFSRRRPLASATIPPDLARYPELRVLDRLEIVPAATLGLTTLLLGGWSGFVVGFCWSTVLLYHCTFFINSLAHGHGSRRYLTGDDSRNNWWLAVLTLGEGWHNNHHAYPRSARQGFRWFEIDPTFYVLKLLSWLRIVRDLGVPPVGLVRNERPPTRATIERAAERIAAVFAPHASALIPTMDQLRARAIKILPQTSALDAICERALAIITAPDATHGATLVECQSARGARASYSMIASQRSTERSVRVSTTP